MEPSFYPNLSSHYRRPVVLQERFGVYFNPAITKHATMMKRTNQLRIVLGIAAAVALSFGARSVHANNTTHSLFGIDVSSYQGYVTWSSVYANGARFAFAKATEGTYYTDADFAGNMTRGKSQGLQMGAWHFARPDIDCPSSEANYFWNFAGPYLLADGKSISPAIDFETFNGHSCYSSYTAWLNKLNALIKAKTTDSLNCVAILSCCEACNMDGTITLGSWLLNYNGQNLYTGNPWNTCCTCNPWDSAGGCNSNGWDYWTVTSTGTIGGVTGNVDFDAYNGTLSQLKSKQGIGGI